MGSVNCVVFEGAVSGLADPRGYASIVSGSGIEVAILIRTVGQAEFLNESREKGREVRVYGRLSGLSSGSRLVIEASALTDPEEYGGPELDAIPGEAIRA